MDLEEPQETDLSLAFLCKQDIYDLSVGDLEERIVAMREEIVRCEAAIKDRSASKSAAENLFKS